MSNEAFEKWAIDYGLDYESSFTRDDVEAAWQAAKAMCEVEASSTEATVLRPPLKRLSDEQISEIAYKVHEGISPHNDTMDFANAIMDIMQEINK